MIMFVFHERNQGVIISAVLHASITIELILLCDILS